MSLKKKIIIGVCSLALVAVVAITAVFAAQSFSATATATLQFSVVDIKAKMVVSPGTSPAEISPTTSSVTANFGTITFSNARETKTLNIKIYNIGSVAFKLGTAPTFAADDNLNFAYTYTHKGTSVTAANIVNEVCTGQSATPSDYTKCDYIECIIKITIKDSAKTKVFSSKSLTTGTAGALVAA